MRRGRGDSFTRARATNIIRMSKRMARRFRTKKKLCLLVATALLLETFCFVPHIEESALPDASLILEIAAAVNGAICDLTSYFF